MLAVTYAYRSVSMSFTSYSCMLSSVVGVAKLYHYFQNGCSLSTSLISAFTFFTFHALLRLAIAAGIARSARSLLVLVVARWVPLGSVVHI